MTKIKQARIDKGITQVAMAELLGVSQPAIASMESRGIIKIDTAVKVGKKLEINPLSLLDIYDL